MTTVAGGKLIRIPFAEFVQILASSSAKCMGFNSLSARSSEAYLIDESETLNSPTNLCLDSVAYKFSEI